MPTAFDGITLGGQRLKSRIAMAPMSRSRAYGPDACPPDATALYYTQRASAGLIITEGIQPTPDGRGYPATPGLHSQLQVRRWSEITAQVHAAAGVIFAQLMHAGRIGHPSLLPEGAMPQGPSAIAADASVFTQEGPKQCVEPRAMGESDISAVIAAYTTAAENAIAAGFDGVEIHAANGFLLHQFLSSNANVRDDRWGCDAAGHARLAAEVTSAVADAVGANKVGIQVSPGNPYNDIAEDHADDVYGALVDALNPHSLAYFAVSETTSRDLTLALRDAWSGVFLLNPATSGRPTGSEELHLVEDGIADMISFGQLFLANPDLPERLARGGPFNAPDPSTFYGGGDQGYVDYPFLDAEPVA